MRIFVSRLIYIVSISILLFSCHVNKKLKDLNPNHYTFSGKKFTAKSLNQNNIVPELKGGNYIQFTSDTSASIKIDEMSIPCFYKINIDKIILKNNQINNFEKTFFIQDTNTLIDENNIPYRYLMK